MTKRLQKGLIGGAILGLFCVIGAYVRSNFTADTNFLLGLWYNRLIIGLVIGEISSSFYCIYKHRSGHFFAPVMKISFHEFVMYNVFCKNIKFRIIR